VPLSIGITYYVANLCLNEYAYRKSIGYPYHPTDIHWNTRIVTLYPFFGLCSGIMAGLLGIGGGLILGPLLLELGLHPTVNFMNYF